jgi:hypothetical protein
MARIRTIKPEFFTSEDIVSLSLSARLLYVATWCEADKEGRLQWKPKTLKMRYFPADSFNIEKACDELVSTGLVVLYGDGLAFIPSFCSHQHINPRESASKLPDPSTNPRVTDASARVDDASVTRREEGKGREGDKTRERVAPSVPDWLDESTWTDFVQMRNRIKKPMTGKAVELMWAKLDAMRGGGSDPVEILNQSIVNSWQDVFPLREQKGTTAVNGNRFAGML